MAKKMDKNLFWAIKTMLKGGATIQETAEYFQISKASVSRAKASETLEEYRSIIAAMNARNRTKKAPETDKTATETAPAPAAEEKPVQVVEHRQTVQIQATHFMMQEQRKTNELLELISRKLAFIVEQLS